MLVRPQLRSACGGADHETIAALQVKLTAAIRPLDAGQEPAASAAVLSDFAVRALSSP